MDFEAVHGIWLLRTSHPGPATGLAGSRPSARTSRRVLGAASWGHQGTSHIQDELVADPAIIRRLDTGQAAYIYRGGVTFVQVKRLIAAPAALAGQNAATAGPSAGPLATVHPAAAAQGAEAQDVPLPRRQRPARRSLRQGHRLNRLQLGPTADASGQHA